MDYINGKREIMNYSTNAWNSNKEKKNNLVESVKADLFSLIQLAYKHILKGVRRGYSNLKC